MDYSTGCADGPNDRGVRYLALGPAGRPGAGSHPGAHRPGRRRDPRRVRPQRPTSILLSDELKEALRKRGKELGVGYQTAAKMILAKYVNAKL